MELSDSTLLAGFLARDPGRTRVLVIRLTPLIEKRLRKRWKGLRHLHDDILAACFEGLVRWRAEGQLSDREKLPRLVSRLVCREARNARGRLRTDKKLKAEIETAVAEPTPGLFRTLQARQLFQKVEKALGGLPPSLEAVYRAQLRAERGAGPPLQEIYGCSAEAAHQRLARARRELAKALVAQDVDLTSAIEELHEGEASHV